MSSFVHKMVGIELLHTFQVIYFAHFTTRYYTHTYGVLRYLSFSAWNFLNFAEGHTHVDLVSNYLQFSLSSQVFTKLIVLSFIIMLAIILLVKKAINYHSSKRKRKLYITKVIYNSL
jgi:hypothetical protein